jgi:hypothetical protein
MARQAEKEENNGTRINTDRHRQKQDKESNQTGLTGFTGSRRGGEKDAGSKLTQGV